LDLFRHKFVVLGVLCVPAVVCLLDFVYFVVLPRFAHRRYRERDPERLRRYLTLVVATPSVFGSTQKLFARESLAGIYLGRGQHAEVVAQFRAGLESLSELWRSREVVRSLEANYRARLADSLEALGQVDEAAAERRRAEEGIDRAAPDALRHRTRAKLLEEQNRHEQAYAEYQKALDLTPASQTLARIECVLHLVLTAHNAGRPADCLRWAEKMVALGAKGRHLRSAHRMAGVACGHLGRLGESELHYRDAYDVAAADNDRPAMAEILASLANCLYYQGKLARANEVCIEAAAVDPKGKHQARAVQGVVLCAWGRYDDALAIYGDERKSVRFNIPRHERRIRAVYSLDCARMEVKCGRVDDAWRHIHEALAELGNDAKLGFKCQAALSLVLAARGDADESQRLAARLESRLATFQRDPSICRGVLYDLGMAACARGDHPAGIDCWTRFLALGPHPVRQPNAYYHRGECHRHLGRLDEARNDYQAAVAMDIDSHFSRLARRRLGELSLL
jgi:tetratricopeptide (TPR) repeat protein